MTDLGYRAVLYLTKLHQGLLAPTLDSFDLALLENLKASPHRLDRALADLNARFDHLAQVTGLKTAG